MPRELSAELARSTSGTNPTRHRRAVGGYRKLLAARGITVSMSRKGDCWECANGRGQPQGEGRVWSCAQEAAFKTYAIAAQAAVEYFGY